MARSKVIEGLKDAVRHARGDEPSLATLRVRANDAHEAMKAARIAYEKAGDALHDAAREYIIARSALSAARQRQR